MLGTLLFALVWIPRGIFRRMHHARVSRFFPLLDCKHSAPKLGFWRVKHWTYEDISGHPPQSEEPGHSRDRAPRCCQC